MSSFPDSWAFLAWWGNGGTPQLTLPACPGIAHVITYVSYKYTAAAAGGNFVYLNWSIGGNSPTHQGIMCPVQFYAAGAGDSAEEEFTGKIAGAAGQAIVIGANAVVPASAAAILTVTGYAI